MKRALSTAVVSARALAQLVQQAPCAPLAARAFSSSRAALGMEEFFPLALKAGETPKHAGA